MRELQLTEDLFQRIDKVKEYAAAHIFTDEMMQKLQNGQIPPPGETPGYSVHMDDGLKVVYSITEWMGELYRIMSIGINVRGKFPSPILVALMMGWFGFETEFELACSFHWVVFDKDNEGNDIAIKVMEPYKSPDGHNQHSEASARAGKEEA